MHLRLAAVRSLPWLYDVIDGGWRKPLILLVRHCMVALALFAVYSVVFAAYLALRLWRYALDRKDEAASAA